MKKFYDVVVVGAGPAGAFGAKFLGENGLDVALLERKTDLSIIQRCCTACMGIKDELFHDVGFFNDRAKRFVWPKSGISVPYDGPTNNVYGFHLASPNGTRVRLGDITKAKTIGNDARVAVVIDKGYLIMGLVDGCRKAGVQVFLNTNMVDLWREREGWVVSDHRGNQYRGRFVLAADGVNSRIMRRLGMNEERKWTGTYRDRSWDLEGAEFDEMEAMIFCMGWKSSISMAPHVNKNYYHVAAASYDWKVDLDKCMQEYMHSKAFAPWFKNAREVGHRTSCVSNIYSSIPVPYKDNVLITGDAGWMQECAINGALLMGFKAANAMVLAVNRNQINREGVSTYLEWWDKSCYKPFGMGGGSGADLKDYISGEDLNYLASLIKKPLRGTLDFYTMYRTIGRAYLEQFPRISEERPDIMQKLMAMRSVHPDVGLANRRRGGFLTVT
jgi:flavin-dependent dehydrogenase